MSRDLSLLQVTQHTLALNQEDQFRVWRLRACVEAVSLGNGSLAWPLGSSEGKILALYSSAVNTCHITSKLINRMLFTLKEIPAKDEQPAQPVPDTAAQGLQKMLQLVHIVDLSTWKLCQSVLRGHIFYTNETENCKESSGQK